MFDRVRTLYDRYFKQPDPIPPGIYTYMAPADAPFPYRLHLRSEKSGEGVLVVNASTVLHLNRTAAEYAYHLITQDSPEKTAQEIAHRYRVTREQAAQDFSDFTGRLMTLIEMPDLDPVSFLDFERDQVYSVDLTAPLRLDCALTYRTADADPESAPLERVKRELMFAEWQQVLDKAWAAGIPHVIFTGGEPTLRPDLVDLIAYAESLGMVTGVLSDGLRFTQPDYFQAILNAGLDHLMIILDPHEDQAWEAVRDTLAADLHVTVHLTITAAIQDEVAGILSRLADLQVKSLSLSEADPALNETLAAARELAAHHQMTLVWDLPVPYSHLNPVALELESSGERPDGSGRAWLYVEPDGDVLPGQGVNHVLGNLLADPWDAIWQPVAPPEK